MVGIESGSGGEARRTQDDNEVEGAFETTRIRQPSAYSAARRCIEYVDRER